MANKSLIAVVPLLLVLVYPYSSASQNSSPLQANRVIKVDVDLVLVSVTVTDSRNRFVQGLSKRHFRVWEDRIEQEISHFSDEDTPVTLGIILDKSGSMGGDRGRSFLDQVRSAAYSCLQDPLRDDEFFLIEFSDSPQVVADFTSDIDRLREKLPFMGAGGSTALWDAIYAGVIKMEKARHTRKALLVLTDGLENRSRYTLAELKRLVREQEVRVYGMDSEQVQSSGLDQLAELTGGRVFRSSNPCLELKADFKSQYVIGYNPTNRAANGAWREIRVRMDTDTLPKGLSNLSVRARAGYSARSESDSNQEQ